MPHQNEPEAITVTDKRRFSVDTSGQAVEKKDVEAKPEPKGTETPADQPAQSSSRAEAKGPSAGGKEIPLPEVDFVNFILSLSQSAIFHLGLTENPMTGKREQNLPIAKHTIDTIAMLWEKTKGNLSQEEDQLLEHVLAELRLRYVEELSRR